jgi:hypothetical protein
MVTEFTLTYEEIEEAIMNYIYIKTGIRLQSKDILLRFIDESDPDCPIPVNEVRVKIQKGK